MVAMYSCWPCSMMSNVVQNTGCSHVAILRRYHASSMSGMRYALSAVDYS